MTPDPTSPAVSERLASITVNQDVRLEEMLDATFPLNLQRIVEECRRCQIDGFGSAWYRMAANALPLLLAYIRQLETEHREMRVALQNAQFLLDTGNIDQRKPEFLRIINEILASLTLKP